MSFEDGVFLTILLAIGLTGTALDIRSRRLPNWLCALAGVTGLVHAVMVPGEGGPLSCLAHGALALLVGMLLFALRWIGGGDAKFYAGLAVWLPLRHALAMVMSTAMAGLLILIVWFAWRRIQGKKIVVRGDEAAKLPYGIAIAAGGLLTFYQTITV